jgi:hypothetical protein
LESNRSLRLISGLENTGGVVAGAGSAYTDKTDKEGFSRVMLRGVRSSRLLGILGPPLDNDLFGI